MHLTKFKFLLGYFTKWAGECISGHFLHAYFLLYDLKKKEFIL